MSNYHEVMGHLPCAFSLDKDGHPRHSWRVLILTPNKGLSSDFNIDSYDLDQPWNMPANRIAAQSLASQGIISIFHCPNNQVSEIATTNYVTITGVHAPFSSRQPCKWSDFEKSRSDVALGLEIGQSNILWTEPRDASIDELASRSTLMESEDPGGPAILFADGKVFRIRKQLPANVLSDLFSIAGDTRRDELIVQGYLSGP